MLSLTKSIVVVDEWVNVHDYEVFFVVGANVDPKRDVELSEGPLDHLDHAPTQQFMGGKIGIDATHKGPLEGTREWPLIEMSRGEGARRLPLGRIRPGGRRGSERRRGPQIARIVTSLTTAPPAGLNPS